MTPEILSWLYTIREAYLKEPGRVLEVGAFNVNGTPRTVFEAVAESYIGTDMNAGNGVDVVVNNADLLTVFEPASFDTVMCCECLEHDMKFWQTVETLRLLVKLGGYLLVTTPTYGFPVHNYPRDYWRFGVDAYEQVFFANMDIRCIQHLDSAAGKGTTLGGIARKTA